MRVPAAQVIPFGSWPSPVSAAMVAAGGLSLSSPAIDGDDLYWLERRPQENGRQVLVRWRGGHVAEITPDDVSVRTQVHQYGGGAYAVAAGVVCYSNFSDSRLYHLDADGTTVPLTELGRWHYADAVIDLRRHRLVCVREDRSQKGQEVVNTLVSVSLDGNARSSEVMASGYDFYSTPRFRPDGDRLCWICWRHPQMPWNGTELWVADVLSDGRLTRARLVAGGDNESIYQPGWLQDGSLIFASDRSGWWMLYRWREEAAEPVLQTPPSASEFGRPAWTFGTSTWAPAGSDRLVATYTTAGRWHLALIDVVRGSLVELMAGVEPSDWIAATSTHAVVVAGFENAPDQILRVKLTDGIAETLRTASNIQLPTEYVSVPEAVEFSIGVDRTVHVFYYPPVNPKCTGLPGERPPLIVMSHGGPTAAASATFSLQLQFWTTRGFAVADVNYGGSSGFGRAHRQRLDGAWGVVDVDDCVAAAQWFASSGRADPARLIMRGSSAGGYTTLATLAFRPDVFKAGASYYGVSDLEVLARDTHKFESRYTETLVGPYPGARDIYRARSPRYAAGHFSCPLILFQGLEDEVVPPNQSALMAEAVRAKGLPVAHLTFEGEQHGFRRAQTIVACLEAELYFYGAVFGFLPADSLTPIPIDNL